MKNKIIPAILKQEWSDIVLKAKEISQTGVSDRVQIDICDGKFVPSMTWPFVSKKDGIDFEKVKINFIENKDAEIYLPEWDMLSYTADIMCENPEQYFENLLAFGFDEFIIHFRSVQNENLLMTLDRFEKIEKFCLDFMIDLTIAIDVKTDLNFFIDFAKKFENSLVWKKIQVMGIREIGKQGEKFDDDVLEIIKKIKTEFSNKEIMMDGGINEVSIKKCKIAGANIFTVGSYLEDKNLQDIVEFLESV